MRSNTSGAVIRRLGAFAAALVIGALAAPVSALALPGEARGLAASPFTGAPDDGLATFVAAEAPPAGFQDTIAFSGLDNPTLVRFAPTAGSSSPRRAA